MHSPVLMHVRVHMRPQVSMLRLAQMHPQAHMHQ